MSEYSGKAGLIGFNQPNNNFLITWRFQNGKKESKKEGGQEKND